MLHLICFDWPSGFREEDPKMVDYDDDGRTTDHGHPLSSPREPNSSGERKNKQRTNGPVNAHLRSEIYTNTLFDYKGHIHVYSPRTGSE